MGWKNKTNTSRKSREAKNSERDRKKASSLAGEQRRKDRRKSEVTGAESNKGEEALRSAEK